MLMVEHSLDVADTSHSPLARSGGMQAKVRHATTYHPFAIARNLRNTRVVARCSDHPMPFQMQILPIVTFHCGIWQSAALREIRAKFTVRLLPI